MINLSKISTKAPKNLSKKKTKLKLLQIREEIADLHHKLYAEGKHSLLVVFQGMDSSGKDGATKNVFGACSPFSLHVKGFKKPTEEEMSHDFLWRVHQVVPAKGSIQVFNRSHYEDVLIQRVHKWIDEDRVNLRFRAINMFEELLEKDNNTTILKFYLHLSKERQEEKLRERIELPEKNWKHNSGDWEERKLWDEYRAAYHDVLNTCNAVPWHIVPADSRWYRNYFVAKIVLKTLQDLDPQLPISTPEELMISE